MPDEDIQLDPTPATAEPPVPAILVADPTWSSITTPEFQAPVWVEMPDGSRASSQVPAHIAQWLTQDGAKIIPEPHS